MLDWVVDPGKRETVTVDGIVQAGLGRIQQLASERACGAPATCSVEARGLREDGEVMAGLGRAGFRAVRTFVIMACELGSAPTTLQSKECVPEGISLRSYRSGDAPAWIAAFNASFSDHWGGFSYTEESWGRHANSPRFREEMSVVAEAGGMLAGICHCAPSLKPREEGLANLHILGVRPEFRRRGLGACLMVEAMGRLRENGFSRVELDMDSLNLRALPLYEQLRFSRAGGDYDLSEAFYGVECGRGERLFFREGTRRGAKNIFLSTKGREEQLADRGGRGEHLFSAKVREGARRMPEVYRITFACCAALRGSALCNSNSLL